MHVKATNPKTEQSVEFDVELGADLAAATELFGAEAVMDGFVRSAKVAAQNVARTKLAEEGETPESVKEFMETQYRHGATMRGGPRVVTQADVLAAAQKMSKDELQNLLNQVAAAKAKAGK